MKRFFIGMLAFAMLFVSVVTGSTVAEEAKISVVTTIFPIYDWVRQVAGDSVQITMLLDDGVDLHSYQPTVADIMTVATCDVFIYVGGESDEWVEDALAEAVNPDMKVVSLLGALGSDVKEEELVEGMEHEHHHDHDEDEDEHDHDEDDHDHDEDDHDEDDHDEDDHDHDEVEYDEHVWLSLRNAQTLVTAIAETLGEADPDNAELYRANAAAYVERLAALDEQTANAVEATELRAVLFGDRFPFRYLTDDYGLTYYAAFSGCSAESEASFETIVFLAGKVDELGLSAVLTIEGSNHRIAETIVENTQAKSARVLTLDSMQSTTAQDVAEGASYLDIMAANMDILVQALTK